MFFFILTYLLGQMLSPTGAMAFQGLIYASGYDHVAVPLMPRDNMSMISTNPELLEEVKDVLIPAERLRIEEGQIIGKGKPLFFTWFHNIYSFLFKVSLTCRIPFTQVTLGLFIMDI